MPTAAAAAAAPEAGLVIADRSNETILVPFSRAVFLRRCHNCTVYTLPTAGSFFLSDCVGLTVFVCCHQLRVKSCQDTTLYTWCASTPVIESCSGMRFGPYGCWEGLASTEVLWDPAVAEEQSAASVLISSSQTGNVSSSSSSSWATAIAACLQFLDNASSLSSDDTKEPTAVEDSTTTPKQNKLLLRSLEDWAVQVGGQQNLEGHAKQAYQKVDDFHWLKQQQSPNWCAMPTEQWARDATSLRSLLSFEGGTSIVKK